MQHAPNDPGLMAGAAKIDITPSVGCWLEGNPRAQPSDAIHDPLHARAFVCEDGTRRMCLVVCDLIGLSTAFADETRRRIADTIGTGAYFTEHAEDLICACAGSLLRALQAQVGTRG